MSNIGHDDKRHKDTLTPGLARDGASSVGDQDQDEGAQAEQKHLSDVVFAFSEYQLSMYHTIARRNRHVSNLLPKHAKYLKGGAQGVRDQISDLSQCALVNQEFLLRVVDSCRNNSSRELMGLMPALSKGEGSAGDKVAAPPLNALPVVHSAFRHMSKIRSTLHQCAREWSVEGKAERDASFTPILQQLRKWLPITKPEYNTKRVLVPGVGLGRLCLEICGQGYACEGNEFSYFMLLTSQYILNSLSEPECVTIHPWIHDPCNLKLASDMTRPVTIPDMTSKQVMANNPNGHLSMCAGEFLEVYGNQIGEWDCIVTCFFIDTAPNVIDYVEAIYRILKPGGVWINLGPLLWHWYAGGEGGNGDSRYNESVELALDQVLHIVETAGFKLVEQSEVSTRYSSSCRSMMATVYNAAQFTCIKPDDDTVAAK